MVSLSSLVRLLISIISRKEDQKLRILLKKRELLKSQLRNQLKLYRRKFPGPTDSHLDYQHHVPKFGEKSEIYFLGPAPQLDEIEEVLYTADIPTGMVQQLLVKLENEGKGKSADEIQKLVFGFMKEKMEPVQLNIHQDVFELNKSEKKTRVFMIVGVNGAGKTTTIGKLATKLKSQGAKVIVGACDTFRAAAVDQLQVWCERAGVDMVRAKDGADPSGVAYDTVAKAFAENYDYCLIDTAGRLHTNQNLMDELAKTKRVMAKINPEAPQEVLLVLDAITGKNALKQAQEFHKTLQLTGIIFTKCDGSAKAGSAVGIVDQLRVPITYIGVGETVDDLHLFDLDLYLKTLVGIERT